MTNKTLKTFFILDVIILAASSLGLVGLTILSFVRDTFQWGIIPCVVFVLMGIWEMPRYKRIMSR